MLKTRIKSSISESVEDHRMIKAGSGRARVFFARSVAVVLLATAAPKIVGFASSYIGRNHDLLSAANPIFPMFSDRLLLLLAAAFEMALATYLWHRPHNMTKFCVVLWMSALLFMYHSTVMEVRLIPTCHCLGILRGPLVAAQDKVSLVLLALVSAAGGAGCASCILERLRIARVVVNMGQPSLPKL